MAGQLEDIKKVFVENTVNDLIGLKKLLIDVGEFDPDLQISMVNDVFMVMHGISGTAPMVGLDSLATLSRKVEIVFDKIRKGEKPFSEQITYQTIRTIDYMISELNNNSEKIII